MICYSNELLACQRECVVCGSWTSRIATEGDKVLYVLCDDHCNARTVKKLQGKEHHDKNRLTGLIRLVAQAALDFKHNDNMGGKGSLNAALDAVLNKHGFPLEKSERQILIKYLYDLEKVEIITPSNPYPKASKFYQEAKEAQQRVSKFQMGEIAVYKRKRFKDEKYDKKSDKTLSWNSFRKRVRAKLSPGENKHTTDDALYRCWEESWGVNECADECKDAYESGKDVRE